jgi:hypothetical protein
MLNVETPIVQVPVPEFKFELSSDDKVGWIS